MKSFLTGIFVFCCLLPLFSQEKELKPFSLEAEYFYGNIIEHNPNIAHLITGHPSGFFLSYNRKTYGFNEWERRYNFPDWGFSLGYQQMENPSLGEVLGIYSHLSWYFLNRNLRISVGQGIAYTDSPYRPEKNYRNVAYGSHFMSTTFGKASFIKENLWRGLGIHAGIGLVHYSNANIKAPNNSTNTITFNLGLNYLMDHENFPEFIQKQDSASSSYAQNLKFNFVFRSGINASDVIGLGEKPFYVISVFADKRLNYKSTLQAGADVFFSRFLKDLITYRSIAYPEDGLSGKEDYKRIGVFLGHEWRFNRVAVISQLGYYLYWPYEFEKRVYARLGLRRYLYNDFLFGTVTLHSHWAKAEAVEFGLGIRI